MAPTMEEEDGVFLGHKTGALMNAGCQGAMLNLMFPGGFWPLSLEACGAVRRGRSPDVPESFMAIGAS